MPNSRKDRHKSNLIIVPLIPFEERDKKLDIPLRDDLWRHIRARYLSINNFITHKNLSWTFWQNPTGGWGAFVCFIISAKCATRNSASFLIFGKFFRNCAIYDCCFEWVLDWLLSSLSLWGVNSVPSSFIFISLLGRGTRGFRLCWNFIIIEWQKKTSYVWY